MKLKDTNQSNIVAAKIISVSRKNITVITEEGHFLKIPLTTKYQQDKTLFASLKDILKAGIWIPVNKKLKKLFSYDWLSSPAPATVPAKN
ncbi:hypothetical protein H5S09_07235 [Limosilactobacillus sp. STM2_1]|uniref:Uncharacterized protein n=1 Tax=Limosilactobacillus rudii TaxID=2759755 RepID=A0A7W3ULH5_9LACO|nr:hypothetical protein [Limosilactobacillus rudii]MBB1079655.1 hypothetical protein [Limosilactobacillus rudii]MBB1097733.1 hypothetical protein [Limosilactobacillus rudii]MCD7134355.1 hypothetical protein [Limosilactobacillus rudii]